MNQVLTAPRAPQGLVTPVSGGMSISPSALIQRVKDIDEVRREVMQENVHYYSLDPDDRPSDERKWSLGKAGAEVLNLAFGLCSDTESVTVFDDPDASHTYRRRSKEWYEKPNGGRGFNWKEEDITSKGRYEVKATCRVYGPGGNLIASASGSANSWESAFRGTAYSDAKNPVMKRAEKRAYVAATLLATASSSMFTQDVEDMDKGHGAQGATPEPQPVGGPKVSWMSAAQEKLLFAKGKAAGMHPEVIDHVKHELAAMGKAKGKPYFDAIADGTPQGGQIWAKAVETVAKSKQAASPEPPATNDDPGPQDPDQ
jgi:hypothetical protein